MKILKIVSSDLYYLDGEPNSFSEVYRRNVLEDGRIVWEKPSQYGTFVPMSPTKSGSFERVYGPKDKKVDNGQELSKDTL